jgi:prefoldin subunit 5
MESFEDFRKKEIENLTAALAEMGKKLIELGWSQEEVIDYLRNLLRETTETKKED